MVTTGDDAGDAGARTRHRWLDAGLHSSSRGARRRRVALTFGSLAISAVAAFVLVTELTQLTRQTGHRAALTVDPVRPPASVTSTTTPLSPQVAPPTSLSIPSLDITAPVIPEGIDTAPDDAGNLVIPADIHQTAWWKGGPSPGHPGVAVIAGHRSSARLGLGALWTLPSLRVGALIDIASSDGATSTWSVTSIETVVKDQLPGALWSTSGPAILAIVTCGGDFDSATGHYIDNVIAWASAAGSQRPPG